MIQPGSKVKIIGIHKRDAYYSDRTKYIGEEGTIKNVTYTPEKGAAMFSCVINRKNGSIITFYAARLKHIK